MQKRIKLYINRYVILLLILFGVQLLMGQVRRSIFSPDNMFNDNMLDLAWIFNWTWLITNLIMTIVIHGDIKRLGKMNYWVLVLTLVSKEFGTIIALMHYFINEGSLAAKSPGNTNGESFR